MGCLHDATIRGHGLDSICRLFRAMRAVLGMTGDGSTGTRVSFATPRRRNQQVVRAGRIQVDGRLYGAVETDRLRDCLEFVATGWLQRVCLTRVRGGFTEEQNFGIRIETSG